jgi:GNAT superfamily N-acetyltransferase
MTHAIAVQKLGQRHRGDIARHLIDLPAEDRRLRFGQPMRDDGIERYVDGIDFARDRVFAIYADDLALAGVAHLALDGREQHAELGLSVHTASRGRGYGAALLARGVLHAANRGYGALYMHCLAENAVMMHLALKAGLKTVVAGGEADARVTLNRAQGNALREAMEEQFALVDYILKQQGSLIQRRAAAPPHASALIAGEMPAG